jgi:pectinesterase inhibitor-like protein
VTLPQHAQESVEGGEVKKTMTTAASACTPLLVLLLCASALHDAGAGAGAARVSPGASPIVATCMAAPFPELCVGELGQRLLDIQNAAASAAPGQGARIAGAPGQVDVKALIAVALEAASEAGSVAASIFEGKLPGFNTGVPDFRKCVGNCSVTMRTAMQKLHGAAAALRSGDHQVARTLAARSFTDVSSCNVSCKDLNGDVRLIIVQSLTEFQKMLQIAIAFINKLPPPARRLP